jgi:MFS family permease
MTERRVGQGLAAFSETARSPNLRRAQLSFGAAWAAEWALTVGVGILAFHHGGAAAVGIVGMARLLPAALLAPLAAVLVDRHPRDQILVAVCLIRALALAGAALMVGLLSSPLPAYGFAAMATLAHTLYRPAHSALLPSVCAAPRELTSANVVRGLLDSLSALVGPLVAGLLVGPFGVSGIFTACAVAAAWSAWLIARLDFEPPPRIADTARAHPVREAIDGLSIMRRRPAVRLLSVLFCLQTFTRGCFAVFSVVIALQLLGTGEAGVGVLTAGFGAGAVLGSFASSLLVGGDFARWFGIGVAGWGVPFIGLAAVSNEGLTLGLLAVVGVANAIIDVAGFTLLQRLVPDEIMGRFFAGLESLFTLTVAAGSLAASGLIALLGVRGGLVATGLLAPLGAGLAWPRLRRLDSQVQVASGTLDLLREVEMLRPLPMATISRLAAEAANEVVPSGTIVILQDAPGDDFYVIADGRAEVLVDGASVAFLGPGECFGEIAALKQRRRTSTIRADAELALLRFSGLHFVRAVTGYTPSRAAADALVKARLVASAQSTAGVRSLPPRG